MKHKVSELTGGLLDAAVAKANGWPFDINPIGDGRFCYLTQGAESFSPSRLWSEGGWIIENELIELVVFRQPGDDDGDEIIWSAYYTESANGEKPPEGRGPTPLIAAMRAYVCSKLGEEVELP